MSLREGAQRHHLLRGTQTKAHMTRPHTLAKVAKMTKTDNVRCWAVWGDRVLSAAGGNTCWFPCESRLAAALGAHHHRKVCQ